MQTAEDQDARHFGQQFQRGARPAGAAEPVRRWRHVREPPGRPAILAAIRTTTGATRSMGGLGSARTASSTDSSRAPKRLTSRAMQYAYQVGASHNTEAWRLGAGYAEVGDNFNPEVGFLARENGFRKAELAVNRNIRLAEGSFWKFHELRPHVGYDSVLDERRRARIQTCAHRSALAAPSRARVPHRHEPDV